ncbi:unnamed protein product [Vicia faba]|uniref:Uncharacterized protein n=1 Tax=Vicia faba TaxID=3906 RepID=A0AAV0ZNP0_VICFA|nr:unnamed protein product [Vicia faba]
MVRFQHDDDDGNKKVLALFPSAHSSLFLLCVCCDCDEVAIVVKCSENDRKGLMQSFCVICDKNADALVMKAQLLMNPQEKPMMGIEDDIRRR